MLSSVDLRIKYLRAMSDGVATVESSIIHSGRRIVHATSVVCDPDGRQLALGDSTLMVVLGKGESSDKGEKRQKPRKNDEEG